MKINGAKEKFIFFIGCRSVTEKRERRKNGKAVKAFYPANQKANDERENFCRYRRFEGFQLNREPHKGKTYLDNLAKFSERQQVIRRHNFSFSKITCLELKKTDARDNFRRSFR